MATIAIAGAGVMGRLLAWQLARAGHCVQVVDPAAGPTEPGAAGFTAAGMLSPQAVDDVGQVVSAGHQSCRQGRLWKRQPLKWPRCW